MITTKSTSPLSLSSRTARQWRRALLVGALVLVSVAAGCARCGGPRSGSGSEQFVSSSTPGFVYVPTGGALADKAQGLLATARGGPGGERLVKLSADIARQLGFDPLTRTGLESAGIHPARSWSVALGAGELRGEGDEPAFNEGTGLYVVLPIKDRSKLEQTLVRLMEARLGPMARGSSDVRGVKLVTLTPESGEDLAFAWAVESNHLFLGSGEEAGDLVASAVLRARAGGAGSMAADGMLSAVRERLGAREVYVHLRRGENQGRGWRSMLPNSVSAGLGVEPRELSVRFFVGLDGERLSPIREFLVGGGADLLPLLPGKNPLVIRGGIDLAQVVRSLESTSQGKRALADVREMASAVELDLDEDLLGNLEPGFAAGFSLSPTANLSRAFDFNPRRNNPLSSYAVRGVGTVKNPEQARKTLEKIAELGNHLGANIESAEQDGVRVYTANYHLGEGLSWALAGNRLIVTGGLKDAIVPWARQLAANSKGDGIQSGDFTGRGGKALFGDQGVALGLDVARLRDGIDELPASAFGHGPGALMARSMASNVMTPLARLKAVAAVAPVEDGVTVEVTVGVK